MDWNVEVYIGEKKIEDVSSLQLKENTVAASYEKANLGNNVRFDECFCIA